MFATTRRPDLKHLTPPPQSDLTPERGSVQRWRQLAVAMLVAGAAISELLLLAPGVSADPVGLVHGAAGCMLALAGLLALQKRRFVGVTRLTIVLMIVAITVLVSVLDGVEMLPLFYVMPMLGAAYLLRRAEVAGITIAAASGLAIGLVMKDPPGGFPWVDYLLTVAVGFAVVSTVRALAENLGTTIDTLRHTSLTDPLTGLLNRRGLEERFARHYDRAVLEDRPMTAMLLDIDHFKAINDRHGHPVGDRALVRFTELLGASCRASDLVARVGGEEFAVVMPGATLEQAITRAEQFASILREDRRVPGVVMTVSVGVATRADVEGGWEAMLVAADAAVYEAKREGRDRIVTADRSGALS